MESVLTREELREKGQFWTPEWVARAMLSFLLPSSESCISWEIFDPAGGEGAFIESALKISHEENLHIHFKCQEVDAEISKSLGKYERLLNFELVIGDYLKSQYPNKFSAIVANPPYIRHHRLNETKKNELKTLALNVLGFSLDGRAGYHNYFFIKSLSELEENGRLSFIMPSDVLEGKSATKLWKWISDNFRIHAIATFSPLATPFPNVDTNAFVVFISNNKPRGQYSWSKISTCDNEFNQWVKSEFIDPRVVSEQRQIHDFIQIGLHRDRYFNYESCVPLGKYVRAMRGIATGANNFFLMNSKQIKQHKLDKKYFVRTIARTRDVETNELTTALLASLEAKGRPTWLLSLRKQNTSEMPKSLAIYIKMGELLQEGEETPISERSLISQRTPWYKMEDRIPPPFLFTYLGRKKARFIRNFANVRPLTTFLCVYPREDLFNHFPIEHWWNFLREEELISNLALVAKTYGSGAIKVEPRQLERTPISFSLLKKYKLLGSDELT